MEEFAETFPALSQWELFLGTLHQLKRIKPNPFKTGVSKEQKKID